MRLYKFSYFCIITLNIYMMKKLLLFALITMMGVASIAQNPPLKGNGQIFWEEHFDWGNPADAKGWTAPAGWVIEDLADNGYTWGWTKDSLKGPFSKRDGGYKLNSTTSANGFLAIDLDYLNAGIGYMDMLYVNSSITLPVMDFSAHPSVILSLEQMFKYLNIPKMAISVSNDNGAHWADFDLKMGTGSGVNALNLPNNQVAHFSANLSDVAAGQSQVTIKITWSGSILYFWMIDDLTFSEAWDYDLKMNYTQAQMVEGSAETAAGFLYMMPKTQILPIGLIAGSVVNNGDYEHTNVHLQAEIKKNGVSQYNESSNSLNYLYFGDPVDTLYITKPYTPVDFGHYEMTLGMVSEETDQVPDNNRKSFYFHVTDSVFARTPDVSEADESPWRNLYQYTHEGDLMGTEFNPVADCQVTSITAFISKANIDADFRFVLLEIKPGTGEIPEVVELLNSNLHTVDSTLLKTGWITLPLTLDGQGEFLKAGHSYMAAVQFWTYITTENLINRKNAFYVGATRSYPDSYNKQWAFSTVNNEWTRGSSYNKMIRLNINNHENRVDGIPYAKLNASLEQNYPNPFDGQTQIAYTLSEASTVTIDIKDITGKQVQLIEQGSQSAGRHTITLTTGNLESGIYFYTLNAGGNRSTKRMILAK